MGVFDGGARSASAAALEETRALQLLKRDVIAFLERNPTVAMQIIATLSNRLRHTNTQLEDIATLPTGPRLARALVRLADLYGKPADGAAVQIDMKISQSTLGAHAGLMRENVNRQLKLWEAEKLIDNQAGFITLLDPDKLRAIGAE